MRKLVVLGIVVVAAAAGWLVMRERAQSPAGRVRAFIDACERGDDAAIRSLLTAKARDNVTLRRPAKAEERNRRAPEYRVGAATVTGDTASVAVTVLGAQGPPEPLHVKLRREEGAWRIFAFIAPVPGVGDITLDLERPETMSAALGLAMGSGLRLFGASLPRLGEQLGRDLRALGEGFARGLRGK